MSRQVLAFKVKALKETNIPLLNKSKCDSLILYLQCWNWKPPAAACPDSCSSENTCPQRAQRPLCLPVPGTLHSGTHEVLCWSRLPSARESTVCVSFQLQVQWCHVGSLKSAMVTDVFVLNMLYFLRKVLSSQQNGAAVMEVPPTLFRHMHSLPHCHYHKEWNICYTWWTYIYTW
jgi:hypothetical protein